MRPIKMANRFSKPEDVIYTGGMGLSKLKLYGKI